MVTKLNLAMLILFANIFRQIKQLKFFYSTGQLGYRFFYSGGIKAVMSHPIHLSCLSSFQLKEYDFITNVNVTSHVCTKLCLLKTGILTSNILKYSLDHLYASDWTFYLLQTGDNHKDKKRKTVRTKVNLTRLLLFLSSSCLFSRPPHSERDFI